MNFVNYRQLVADVQEWSDELPRDICAVVGIPRSGLLPALILSLYRNCHLAAIDEVLRGAKPWTTPLRRSGLRGNGDRILIVDDSIQTGKTLSYIRKRVTESGLEHQIDFGAVYFTHRARRFVEYGFTCVPHPRCFEWNLFHCNYMQRTCADLDGVLCRDYRGREGDTGSPRVRWLEHVHSAAPQYWPSMPLLAIVTSRLELDRQATEQWLAQHNIRYGRLFMSPHPTARDRRQASDHAVQKAKVYAKLNDALLFIESDIEQAETIARFSNKPVICAETMELVK